MRHAAAGVFSFPEVKEVSLGSTKTKRVRPSRIAIKALVTEMPRSLRFWRGAGGVVAVEEEAAAAAELKADLHFRISFYLKIDMILTV